MTRDRPRPKTVTSSEFRAQAGRYLDDAAKAPVVITRHNRPVRVLVDVEEYERLKSYDTRRAYAPEDLPDHLKDALEKGYQGADTPDLDPLLE